MTNELEARQAKVVLPAYSQVRPKRLIVLVPGLGGHSTLWKPLIEKLRGVPEFAPAEVMWLPFDHLSQWYSIGRLDQLGRQLNARIAGEWLRAGGFDDVVLIGHSMGGLIARHAYLLGSGGVPGEGTSDWASRVSRIVLMASLNRGVDLRKQPWFVQFMAYIARVTPLLPNFLVLDLPRGSDFLTNLRINWIRHFGKLPQTTRRGGEAARQAPLVVQLLGTEDGVVGPDDSKDVLAFPEGHYLQVPDANHRAVYRLDIAKDSDLRFAVLHKGLAGTFPNHPARSKEADPVRRVVFLLHGIRASNVDGWVERLERLIKQREPSAVVKNPTYGYFTAARFALPTVRKKNIRVFQDWYTEALAEHPAAEFDIIAHSNGTYILGHSLLNTPGMRFTNVALAGSVLPQNFWQRFEMLGQQVRRIRNDRANRDWPVALLCNALAGIRMRDVGTGGFAGFLGNCTHEVAYYAGGHGEALKAENLEKVVDFALGGPVVEPANLTVPGYYRQLSNSMRYLSPLVVLAVMCGVGWFVFQGGQFHLERALGSLVGFVAAYAVLDVI